MEKTERGDEVFLNQDHGRSKMGQRAVVTDVSTDLTGRRFATLSTPDGKTLKDVPQKKVTKKKK